MKWIYGKQDWKTYERGQENCYLMTNGLGGFSSMTMTGSVSRNDHAFLMACVKAPNHRFNIIHRIAEQLETGEESFVLSSQEFQDGNREEGYRHLSEFAYEDTPRWSFHVSGVEIIKEAALRHGENTAVLRYQIENRSGRTVRLKVTPFYQFAPKGHDLDADQKLADLGDALKSGKMTLHYMTDGIVESIPERSETYYYSYDACDGRRKTGSARALHRITAEVKSKESKVLSIVYSMEKSYPEKYQSENAGSLAAGVINEMKQYRENLKQVSGFSDETAQYLAKSAEQFIALRESTGGKTILAGFPFFEDWGRDTMIALPGLCISTGRYKEAESILRTFAGYERNGLMPNLFPEGGVEPMYNTADAALLFINCVWMYYNASKDRNFLAEMYPVMERIIRCYREGTDYDIHMEDDGLIAAGRGLDQVTWMDIRVGDILPTPRHGKPVEINAYWYNAQRIMAECARLLQTGGECYGQMADQIKRSFLEQFWMEDKGCLKDVVSGTEADFQVRCNQIWAVSMPFTMLDEARERQVVDTVFEKLYTPYGLRTLEMGDKEFKPFYGGELLDRDLAYHQGTVWAYPLGAYYLAYLKVNGYSAKAKEHVRGQLEVLGSALREGCVGQLPEIYDGENPVSSKGCFAQAWSVGELLRVYEALET